MKSTTKPSLFMVITMVAGAFFLMSFLIPQDQKKGGPWDIPPKYQTIENPHADEDPGSVAKMLWSKHCKSCHGSKGLGDGPKAKQLETFPGDFSTETFKNQSDGVIYYKSYIGRDEMPNYEKKITEEEDRWLLVNYMRGF
jgi:mono/diheme cytochrome c family protein